MGNNLRWSTLRPKKPGVYLFYGWDHGDVCTEASYHVVEVIRIDARTCGLACEGKPFSQRASGYYAGPIGKP